MPPARPPHPENSTAGLVLLDAEHEVVATGEEHHQGTLSRFAPRADGRPRQVVVALRPAPVTRGRHAGQPGVEVLLDGQRVGELTHRMAQRYGPLIRQVLLTGGRPGCRARIARGRRGLEVVLRLPVSTERAGAAAPSGPAPRPIPPPPRSRRPADPSPPGPQPPHRPGGRPRRRKPLWIGAGVGAALLIIGGSIGSVDDAASPTGPVSAAAASTSATATSTSPAPTPTPTATSTALLPTDEYTAPEYTAPPRTTVRVPPPPGTRSATARPARETSTQAPSAPEPDRTTTRKPTAKAAAGSGGGCSPDYSGCVPIATDVDCAGGSGNGPKYVSGPLRVTGSDVYDLDRDGNGIACE